MAHHVNRIDRQLATRRRVPMNGRDTVHHLFCDLIGAARPGVNDLVVRFLRIDQHAETGAELLVMERLYPLDYRTFEVEKRELFLEVFEDELKQLHKQGFVHRDIKRPPSESGLPYDNVFLTTTGIRLIDVGIAALRSQVGDRVFEKYIESELQELAAFKKYFIER